MQKPSSMSPVYALFMFFTLFSSTLTTSQAEALTTPQAHQVKDYPHLQKLLSCLEEEAADGASLEYFGYQENLPFSPLSPANDGLTCRPIDRQEAVDTFIDIVETVESGMHLCQDLVERGVQEFTSYLKDSHYEVCTSSQSRNRSLNYRTYLVRPSGRAQIVFELGYED